ncbi:MAG: SurA N-terminal domain-containing protein, partial [Gemmatimonadota bacterium]
MVMRALREKTQVIILILALAFVGLMVFEWGMNISGQSGGFPTEVGRVNGTPIPYEQWRRVYQNLTDQAREEKGGRLTDEELRQVEETAWNQLVSEILVQQELERLGIEVTEGEIRLAFRTMPPPWVMSHPAFQTDGQFDYEKYREYFGSPAADRQLLLQIENYYRELLPRTRLAQQLGLGIYVTDAELWQAWRDRHERVRAEYVVLDPRALVPDDSVSVSDAEVRRAYETRPEEFRREAQAEVSVVSLLQEPTAGD